MTTVPTEMTLNQDISIPDNTLASLGAAAKIKDKQRL
jgi:hypothetical protein